MKTKVDENTTPETIIAEAMVGAGAPLMHSRVEEAVAGALRKAGMLVERSEQVCAWCPSSARGSAWHNDGKLHPSCGQIDHGQGWVPEYPVDVLMSVRVERDAALAAIERVRDILNRDDFGDDWEHDEWVYRQAAEKQLADIEAALDGAPEPEWEYAAGYTALDGKPHPFENSGYLRFVAEADREKYGSDEAILVRRRKAGPWLQVEGESKP